MIGGVANAAPAIIGAVVENGKEVDLGLGGVLAVSVSAAYLICSMLFVAAMITSKK